MALVVYAKRAFADFERIYDFLAKEDTALAKTAVLAISDAVSVLERHPLIGRPNTACASWSSRVARPAMWPSTAILRKATSYWCLRCAISGKAAIHGGAE